MLRGLLPVFGLDKTRIVIWDFLSLAGLGVMFAPRRAQSFGLLGRARNGLGIMFVPRRAQSFGLLGRARNGRWGYVSPSSAGSWSVSAVIVVLFRTRFRADHIGIILGGQWGLAPRARLIGPGAVSLPGGHGFHPGGWAVQPQ